MWPYDDAWKIQTEREDEDMWTQGLYIREAVMSSIGNAFKDKYAQPFQYPDKPYIKKYRDEHRPLTEEEKDAQIDKLFTHLSIMEMNFNLTHKNDEAT